MKFKTRLNNILAKLANKEGARDIKLKTKDETLLAAINDMVEPFVVTFSGTTGDSSAACDKTWAEIKAAHEAGREIVAVYKTMTTSGSIVTSSTALDLDTQITLEFDGGAHITYLRAYGYTTTYANSNLAVYFISCSINSSSLEISILVSELTTK